VGRKEAGGIGETATPAAAKTNRNETERDTFSWGG